MTEGMDCFKEAMLSSSRPPENAYDETIEMPAGCAASKPTTELAGRLPSAPLDAEYVDLMVEPDGGMNPLRLAPNTAPTAPLAVTLVANTRSPVPAEVIREIR